MIMQKIIEDFLDEIQFNHQPKQRINERTMSLMMFTRRLILLNNEKA